MVPEQKSQVIKLIIFYLYNNFFLSNYESWKKINFGFFLETGQSLSKQRWTASSWRSVARHWRMKTGDCKRRYRNSRHWNWLNLFTCTCQRLRSPCARLVKESVAALAKQAIIPRILTQYSQWLQSLISIIPSTILLLHVD